MLFHQLLYIVTNFYPSTTNNTTLLLTKHTHTYRAAPNTTLLTTLRNTQPNPAEKFNKQHPLPDDLDRGREYGYITDSHQHHHQQQQTANNTAAKIVSLFYFGFARIVCFHCNSAATTTSLIFTRESRRVFWQQHTHTSYDKFNDLISFLREEESCAWVGVRRKRAR